MRTSVASLSGVRTLVPERRTAAGCGPSPPTLTSALVRIGLPGVTAAKPATSTTDPARSGCASSVSMRAPPVPSLT